MRRQRFWWTYLAGAIVCTVYGGFTLIYHFRHDNGLSVHALVLLILGVLALILFLVLYVISLCENKKKEQAKIEEKVVETQKTVTPTINRKRDYEYAPRQTSRSQDYYDHDAYVRLVGHGPVLRVTGARILDMRSNTYYRIQDNMVYQDGSGPVFEISGNKIRSAFGGYLYEISGSNVNKIVGGFFASISGNMITKYDASERYELSDRLNTKQLLVVIALLFGQY